MGEERSRDELLLCERLVIDGGTQVRRVLSETLIQEYVDVLRRGGQFPPLDVYFDGDTYWLADGFHRLEAAKRAGYIALAATIHPGGMREALLHSLGANADRRHAVQLMLADAEWREWSNQKIARHCNGSEVLVPSNDCAAVLRESPWRVRRESCGRRQGRM